ncbi:MAG: TIGR02757 family protein [Acidobacteria bacterium]|nr:MAG: TIGR02757 family protein [Acidobacteriota bacterium]
MPLAPLPDLPRLKECLSVLSDEWEGRRLDSDPLLFPHRYPDPADREVVAFLAASLAFGRVASIRASVERVLSALGPSPAAFLAGWDGSAIAPLATFRHRWVGPSDLRRLLRALSVALRRDGSLRALFSRLDAGGEDYVPALSAFYETLRADAGGPRASRGLGFLLPSPDKGGACKRAHLFLRWMVRTHGFDLGLWRSDGFTPARLLLPMDTHVHRICLYLGLTSRRAADLASSREATALLRRLFPADPAGCDWALSRMGILAECVADPSRSRCSRCAVAPVCRRSRARGAPTRVRLTPAA